MRILLVHNRYQQRGGEDQVFEAEAELLSIYGNQVDWLIFDNNNIRTWSDRLKAAAGMLYNRQSSKRVKQKIESFHPDIIHVHNFVPLGSPSIFYTAGKYHVPVILTLHNYRLICPSATLFFNNRIYEKSLHTLFPFDAVIKGVYRHSVLETAAVAMTTFLHHLIGTWKKKISRYIVMTNFGRKKFEESALAIPQDKFALKPNFVKDYGDGMPEREDFFLFVGRLSEEKGIRTLLGAASEGFFNLSIIGDGPMKKEVVTACGKFPNIRYLGYREKSEVIANLKKCRALICCSENYEGFPITILEAFSTGTPVIASRLGSMEEIVKDGFNGLHFHPGNKKDLCNAIKKIANNIPFARSVSRNARLTYQQEFTPENNYKMILDIYKSAIKETQITTGHKETDFTNMSN